MTLDEMTIRPPAWVEHEFLFLLQERPAPVDTVSLAEVGGTYEIECGNGYGVTMWRRIDDPTLWEVELFAVGLFGNACVPPAVVGLWPWQLSGLASTQVERVQQLVAWLELGAKPVPDADLPEPKREGEEW